MIVVSTYDVDYFCKIWYHVKFLFKLRFDYIVRCSGSFMIGYLKHSSAELIPLKSTHVLLKTIATVRFRFAVLFKPKPTGAFLDRLPSPEELYRSIFAFKTVPRFRSIVNPWRIVCFDPQQWCAMAS
ncbi:hypothetical protein Ddc_18160 [Ditylenchus destructor]|nr:hypothetical protein Ddc_18160 [Ditylenchus destructor]